MVMVKRETVVQKPMRLGDFIREFKRWIMVDWEREVRRHPFSQGLFEPRLLGHLPDLLDWVAGRVEAVHTGGHPAPKEPREGHPLALLATGQDLEEVVHEYALLRACILRLYEAHAEKRGGGELAVTLREVRRFDETFDEAVSTAVSHFSRTRESTRVDPFAEVVLGPEDLELLLPELRACLPGQEDAQRRLLEAILAIKRRTGTEYWAPTLRSIERFLGFINHDLRNPLNVIALSARMMVLHEGGVEPHARYLRRISAAARRMERMLSCLKDLMREQFLGGLSIGPRAANLQQLWPDVLKELEDHSPQQRLRLSTQGDLQGEWDPERMVQLLGSLCMGALCHGHEEGIVDCALRDEGDTVCMEVHYGGPTIPEDLLPRLFTSFGISAGLGDNRILLAIVRAHGGTLDVRSTDAEGTTFTVKLPRYHSRKKAGDLPSRG